MLSDYKKYILAKKELESINRDKLEQEIFGFRQKPASQLEKVVEDYEEKKKKKLKI